MKCQIPLCNKETTKEIHINEKVNLVETTNFLCEEHFKQESKWLRHKNIPQEIFELNSKVDDRVKVEFT